MKKYSLLVLLVGLVFLFDAISVTHAEIGLKWGGKLWTAWRYRNDDTESSVYTGAFGAGGGNGINSELELRVTATISEYAEVNARINNRFRKNYWATWWDNNGETAGSGETMEANQYLKLRGVYAKFRPPQWADPIIKSVLLGASDFGMFNAWTVGRIRYTDRDNGMGSFVSGAIGDSFTYDLARISLPTRWAGPGWTTRGSGYHTASGFMNRDFAYAAAMRFNASDRFKFDLIGDYTKDVEGALDDTNERDGHDYTDRFTNTVISAEFSILPTDIMDINLLGVYAESTYNDTFNYIEKWGGYTPLIQKDCDDFSVKALMVLNDPFGVGLNISLEYFNIGEDFQSLMAARRESDVLITEGFEGDDVARHSYGDDPITPPANDWGGWNGNMGQAPTLNVDNDDTQWTEMAYQSIIGWNGGTLLLNYASAALELAAEYTHIGYNTNMQNRDMTIYPENNGFGSANGVYSAYQDRKTDIALVKGKYAFFAGKPFEFTGKIKWLHDVDTKNDDTSSDDYDNTKMIYDLGLGLNITDEIFCKAGYTYYDKDVEYGGTSYPSQKNRLYLTTRYDFGGIKIAYTIENYTGKERPIGWDDTFDDYNLTRSFASLEVPF